MKAEMHTPGIGAVNSLADLLQQRAKLQPDRLAYIFLADGEQESARITYSDLDIRARAIAAVLQNARMEGERALLLYPSGLDYVTAFWGCIYAGVVAIPTYPPHANRQDARIQAILADAQAKVILTDHHSILGIQNHFANLPDMNRLQSFATDEINMESADQWVDPHLDLDSVAFLQYTSGSTTSPRGVMLTHSNLLANQQMINTAFELTEQDKIVGWLPLYHDMGLIGNIIHSLYSGARCVFMPPSAFVQKPIRWLQAIMRFGATVSGGPNFAYDFCVRRISDEDLHLLDLSSWRIAFNGAEPIRSSTLDAFSTKFSPCGFRKNAFFLCYGLAEATLFVSGSTKGNLPEVMSVESAALEQHKVVPSIKENVNSFQLVSSGQTGPKEEVVIVNTQNCKPCNPDEVGEIWVSGPNVALGYWNREQETQNIFQALLNETKYDGRVFLRTGDLGFINNGNLFITGRLKDLIIIRGENHYPQDIELTAELSHPAIKPNGGAAFSIDLEQTEYLVLVQEIDHHQASRGSEITEAIRQAVVQHHGIPLYSVVLLKTGGLPRTSSGKTQRHKCRELFLNGNLQGILWTWQATKENLVITEDPIQLASEDNMKGWLCLQIAKILNTSPANIDSGIPIIQYGLDSLTAVELGYIIESTLSIEMSIAHLLQGCTINELSNELWTRMNVFDRTKIVSDHSKKGSKPATVIPLSAGQRSLWFLHQLAPESSAYHISAAVRILGECRADDLKRYFEILVERHSALRTTFPIVEGQPIQHINSECQLDFECKDASLWSISQLQSDLDLEACRPFDLVQGPLFRVRLYSKSSREKFLLLAIHHSIADLRSLEIIWRELKLLYDANQDGYIDFYKTESLQYSDYVSWQNELLQAETERLETYWQNCLAGELPIVSVPTDRLRPPIQTDSGSSYHFILNNTLTSNLKSLSITNGATFYSVLLTSYNMLLFYYTGQRDLIVGSPASGRDRLAWANVVGYFVNLLVLKTQILGDPTFRELLLQVRQMVLSAMEHQDYPFQMLVEKLKPIRNPSYPLICQVMFVFQQSYLLSNAELAALIFGESGIPINLGDLLT